MHRCKAILIAFLATLAATFTIELPFTQVNYIHQLAHKKEHGITSAAKDTHRLHKTYYESPGDMLFTPFPRMEPPGVAPAIHPEEHALCHPVINRTDHPNVFRGPPSLA